MVVPVRELVGGDNGFAQHAQPVSLGGPDVRQCLEHGKRDDKLADAADVLLVVAAVLGVTRLLRVGEIQHGNAVVPGMAAEQSGDLFAEGRVDRRQVEVAHVEQAQVDLFSGKQGAWWLLVALELAALHQPPGLQPAQAGLAITVQRVGLYLCRQCHGDGAERCGKA